MEKPDWRVTSSSYVIDTPFLRMRKDEVSVPSQDGLTSFFVRESRGFAIVFALTSENEILLVRQYRYGIDGYTLELPAGTLDGDEDPLECAQRELREETGFTAQHWDHVLDVAAEPVRSTSIMHVFLARGARRTNDQQLDPFEVLTAETMPIERVRAALRSGEFGAAHSVAASFAALDYLECTAQG
jgi:ADP-ribose pyrophosphatase